MKNILVTGYQGFIGQHLVLHLLNLGHEVSGLGYGDINKKNIDFKLSNCINGKVNTVNLKKLYFKKKPDIIFHLAGGASVSRGEIKPEEDFEKNIVSIKELLEWVKNYSSKTKIVLTSSAAVYGNNRKKSLNENDKCTPESNYGLNKKKVENLCLLYHKKYMINSVILRLFSVYGPKLKKQLLWDLCTKLLKKDKPLILGGTGKEKRDWIYIEDVVDLMTKIAFEKNLKKKRIINIGTGIGTTVKSISDLVLKKWNSKLKLQKEKIKFSGKKRKGDPFNLIANINFLSNLGLSHKTNIEDGINNYVNWFKKTKL